MKKVKFIQHLNIHGCGFLKHGSKHDKYINHHNGNRTYVPRHADIDTDLCSPQEMYPMLPLRQAARTLYASNGRKLR